MDWIKELIKGIPWERLSEKGIILVVALILLFSALYLIIKYREKRLTVDRGMQEVARTIADKNNETIQKEIEKFDGSVNIGLGKNTEVEDSSIGNVKAEGTAKVQVTVNDGAKIKNSKVGNING